MLSLHPLLEKGPLIIDKRILNKDESIKKFFPSLWNAISGDFQTIFPVLTSRIPEEEKLWKGNTKGLNMRVMTNNSNSPNAYTLPAMQSKLGAQAATFFVPIYILYGFIKLSDADLDGRGVNKKVNIKAPNDLSGLMWETKGLKSLIPEDNLRYAIMLHEIGHWVKYEQPFLSTTMRYVSSIAPPLALPFVIGSILVCRSGEKKADMFVKKVGYGKELSEALSRMGYYKRNDVSAIARLGDHIRVFMLKLQDKIDDYVPFLFSHPSIKKRTTYLKDNLDHAIINGDIGYDEYIIELYELDLIEENVKDLLLTGLSKLFAPIDKLAAKHAKFLFPLSQK
jgi:hypothetical protein